MSMARPVRLPKRAKYRAVPTVVDGIRFASKKEAKRYSELKLMEKAGQIGPIERQPRYPIIVNRIPICTYVADFRYLAGGKLGDGPIRLTVEDTKGFRTPEYRLKKKLVEALYGIEILET
jgi:hypothetical protein